MALRDVLVYLDESEGAAHRLRLGVTLAQCHASRLTALYVGGGAHSQLSLQRRKTAELACVSFDELRRLDCELEAEAAHVEQRLYLRLLRFAKRTGLDIEWRAIYGEPSIVVPQHSRYADLCIIGGGVANQSGSPGYSFAEEMLFVSGRPILLIPSGGTSKTLGRKLLIAWNSSRASARSVQDALSLIERAEQVTVLAVNQTRTVDTYGALPAQHLIEHLRLHGTCPTAISVENVASAAIAGVIEAKAREVGADLIVAGAYGHPRLREKLLGGVTRDLLATMTLPLLMSH